MNWLINQMKNSKQMLHFIKIGAGAYLVYLCYNLFQTYFSGESNILFPIAGVIFAICGIFFAGVSVYALFKGYYLENTALQEEEEASEEIDEESAEAEDEEPAEESDDSEAEAEESAEGSDDI